MTLGVAPIGDCANVFVNATEDCPTMNDQLQYWEDMQRFMQANQLQQLEYVDLFQRLGYVCQSAGSKFGPGSVCVFQPWLSMAAYPQEGDAQDARTKSQLFASPMLGLDGGEGFQAFRHRSCMSPLSHSNSMPGRVWRTGALQVVQSLKIIPPGLHPRSNLADDDLNKVAEALYIPVYDSLRPTKGAVSVLEVFLSSKATESMLVADFISFVTSSLAEVNLSLSNPQPQPIHRSSLCGRRARAPADSSEDLQPGAPKATGSKEVNLEAGRRTRTGAEATSSGQAKPTASKGVDSGGVPPKTSDWTSGTSASVATGAYNSAASASASGDEAGDSIPVGAHAQGDGCTSDGHSDGHRHKMLKTSTSSLIRSKSMHTVRLPSLDPE